MSGTRIYACKPTKMMIKSKYTDSACSAKLKMPMREFMSECNKEWWSQALKSGVAKT